MEQNVQTLAKSLPLKLRLRFRADVMECAIEENIIRLTDDGRMEWLLENKTLLAYFCGRMWCGDECAVLRYSHKRVWKTGRGKFPERDLTRLFGVGNLRTIRAHMAMMKMPENFEIIDNLFVTH